MGNRTSQLFDPGPADTASLSDNQRTVLEHIGTGGITAQDAGRLLYPDSPIAASYGRAILQRLKHLGLVVERRNPTRYERKSPAGPSGDIPY